MWNSDEPNTTITFVLIPFSRIPEVFKLTFPCCLVGICHVLKILRGEGDERHLEGEWLLYVNRTLLFLPSSEMFSKEAVVKSVGRLRLLKGEKLHLPLGIEGEWEERLTEFPGKTNKVNYSTRTVSQSLWRFWNLDSVCGSNTTSIFAVMVGSRFYKMVCREDGEGYLCPRIREIKKIKQEVIKEKLLNTWDPMIVEKEKQNKTKIKSRKNNNTKRQPWRFCSVLTNESKSLNNYLITWQFLRDISYSAISWE